MKHSAHDITLARGGKWLGDKGLISCPAIGHDDKTPSCIISGGLDDEPMVHCLAGCDWREVKSGLVAQGLIEPFAPERKLTREERRHQYLQGQKSKRALAAARLENENKRRNRALAVWRAAQAEQDLVEPYFNARGITEVPPIFRHHRGAWHPDTNAYLPAILVPVRNIRSDDIQGCQRIFLDETGRAKADVSPNKMTLGLLANGVVKLAAPTDELAICEGVETGLSFMQIHGVPTWCLLGTSNFKTFRPPRKIRRVTIAADNDEAGIAAAKALHRDLTVQGLKAEIIRPKKSNADFNDVLNGGAA